MIHWSVRDNHHKLLFFFPVCFRCFELLCVPTHVCVSSYTCLLCRWDQTLAAPRGRVLRLKADCIAMETRSYSPPFPHPQSEWRLVWHVLLQKWASLLRLAHAVTHKQINPQKRGTCQIPVLPTRITTSFSKKKKKNPHECSQQHFHWLYCHHSDKHTLTQACIDM